MERFISALSLTLLLSGFAAISQIQPPSDNLVTQVVEFGLSSHLPQGEAQTSTTISRAELARILAKAFNLEDRSVRQVATPLRDVSPTHWAYRDIQLVTQNRVMVGDRNGYFYPDQRVTRVEAYSIFAQAHGGLPSDQSASAILAHYQDADEIPDWAKRPLATALQEGFVNTRQGDRLEPLSPMTRGDMAYALSIYLLRQEYPSDLPWRSHHSTASQNHLREFIRTSAKSLSFFSSL